LRRQQTILFVILFAISLFPHILSEQTRLALATEMSTVLLYPVRVTSALLEYLNVSSTRIERLEIRLSQLHLENALLRDRLEVDTTQIASPQYVLLKARVIGRDPLNINGYLHVDKGTNHGVAVNQPAITVNGFVGKVKHAGPTTSVVETLENSGFTVSAVDVKTGIHGVVRKQEHLTFLYVRHTDTINVGDAVITSGMSEIYPKGILLGTVQMILESDDMFFKNVYVSPAVQINRLTSLYIIETKTSAPGG
jgi:rod shape-determining protein MreC